MPSTSRLIAALSLLGGLTIANSASARTWYVAADGSGDAPTIDAAVDSSSAGDVILVGPGTYYIGVELGALDLKSGTTLESEMGPAVTKLLPYYGAFDQFNMVSAHDGCVIRGFTIRRVNAGTIYVWGNGTEISGNIIEESGADGAITLLSDATMYVHHNVIYGDNYAIVAPSSGLSTYIANNIILGQISQCGGAVTVYCNDVTFPSACVTYGTSNFNLDPMFCGPDDYSLQASSPCAPGNHPDGYDCGLIGALPVGCGSVAVEPTSWGRVKARYRE